MEWALTSSVNVTSTNTTDTNESAAALRLIGELKTPLDHYFPQ